MMRVSQRPVGVTHEFVEFIPSELKQGTIYVSIPYATSSHLCLCGCGQKVVTPVSPAGWTLTFDGETISLHPSIGNWSFRCQSHYWIKRNQVEWAGRLTPGEIDLNRAHDRALRQAHYGAGAGEAPEVESPKSKRGVWSHLWARFWR
jgi:hypothetical protein